MATTQLRELLRRIDAGESIDWDAVEKEAPDEDSRGLLRDLRLIQRLTTAHLGSSGISHEHCSADLSPSTPQSWGPLRILSRIGGGSFGDVFLALDPRLDRRVALKLLRRRDRETDALSIIDEGRLMARVRHPNVVTVHGAERIDGRVGLWMEFIDGRTLAEEIEARGPMEAKEVVRTAIGLSDALQAVHGAGLLHRDITSRNVMRHADGRVVLMDFGAGLEVLQPTGAPRLAGTPLYLAPEVLDGAPATVQSDLYSLGVLLWYAATGDFPVNGSTVSEIRSAHSHRIGPTGLRNVRPDLPATLSSIIERLVDSNPDRRYRTAADLAAAVREFQASSSPTRRKNPWVAVVILAISTLSGVAGWRMLTSTPAPDRVAFNRLDAVVVMPFENQTGDAALDGVFDAALNRELSLSSFVTVASRDRIADALRLMRRDPSRALDIATAREICARDSGLRPILTGRLEKTGDRFVITAGFVDPANGQLTGEARAYASDFRTFAHAVREVSNRLRALLGEDGGSISRSHSQLEEVTTSSLHALRSYTESYRLWTASMPRNPAAAKALVEQALSLDPDFPAARIWHAWILRETGVPVAEYQAAAKRALLLVDRTQGWEQHWIRGSYYFLLTDRERAVEEFEKLLALRPDHERALFHLSYTYARMRRFHDQARIAIARAALRPNDVSSYSGAAQALAEIGDFERARKYVDRLQVLLDGGEADNPGTAAYALTIPAYDAIRRRDTQAALAAFDRLAGRFDEWTVIGRRFLANQLAHGYLSLGRIADARAIARRIEPTNERHVFLARIANFAGDSRAVRESIRLVTIRGLLAERSDGHTQSAITFMINAGLLDQAEREIPVYVEFMNSPRRMLIAPEVAPERGLVGQLAVARGDIERGISLLEGSYADRRAMGLSLGVAQNLSKALVLHGDLQRAASVLKDSLADREARTMQPQYRVFIPALFDLSQIYRRLGDEASARPIEDELLQLLAQADPDLPMLVELQKTKTPAPVARAR